MNISVLFAFGAMICWGAGDFLIQKTVKKIGSIEALFWITFFSSFFLLPWAWHDLLLLNGEQILWLCGLGLVGFFSGALHLKAMRVGKLSVVEAILSLELAVSAAWGIIIFREHLSEWQIVLLVMTLVGIVILSIDPSSWHPGDWLEKGSLLAVLSAFIIGTINFLTAVAAKELSPVMALYLPWLLIGFICLAIISRRGFTPLLQNSRRHWLLILFMVIIDLAAWVFFALAVSQKELAVTITITESYVVVAMMLGVLVNKEKLRLWQYLGAAVAVCSSIAIGIIS